MSPLCPRCGELLIEQDDNVRILSEDGKVTLLDMFWCEQCAEEYGVKPKGRVCTHPNPEHGQYNDYCPACGATRSVIRKGADWHICEACAL